jgi:cell division protein FtsW
MMVFARTDRSLLGEWWWTIDRWSFLAIVMLVSLGTILCFAASPSVAERIGLPSLHFVDRQVMFLFPAVAALFLSSLLGPRAVRRLAAVMLVLSILLLVATLFAGTEIKGARRWINIGSLSLQPSEFVKPALTVIVGWLLAHAARRGQLTGYGLALALFLLVLTLFVLEPDFGQSLLIAMVWGTQMFLAGVPWVWLGALALLGLVGVFAAYTLVPHVGARIDRFLDPSSGDTYQVDRAHDAIVHGGLLGVGPGDGAVKRILPDAHTDFIFAVAAEEYGLPLGLLLILLFGFIVIRGLARALADNDPFVQLAASGLFVLFGLQAFINIAVNLMLLPPKGMTLPFVSYGGSSLVALALTIGLALALTRKRAGARFLGDLGG